MTKDEFQVICDGVVDSDQPIHLHDVLNIAHEKGLIYATPVQKRQKSANGKVQLTLNWLEVVFFLDMETAEIEFYGVQPVFMDMGQSQGSLQELPGIPLDGRMGQPQSVDWQNVASVCDTFNSNLPVPAALPFVRLAIDETRSRSIYYRLRTVDYPPVQ